MRPLPVVAAALLGLTLHGLTVPGAGPAAADEATPSATPSATAPVGSADSTTTPPLGGPLLAGTRAIAQPGPGGDPLPEIWAATWILADATTGDVLAAKRAHQQRPPASTLKTLTLLTLLPRLPADTVVTGSPRAARIEGAKAGVVPGREYTVEQLYYGLMLPSGNDAAIALAQANGGVRKTVRQMNEVARSLRALDTVARTPNGLDRSGQVSSAYDLALIARAGLARPDFAKIVRTKRYEFPSKGRGMRTIYTQNRLLTDGFKGAVGVKTGFTSEAGRTFVGAATRKGRTLIFVGMGIKESSFTAARKALNWGFANRDTLTPVGTLVAPTAAAREASLATATPSPTASIDLSTAGLEVPDGGDPMAPWWFWLVLVLGIAALFVLWRARKVRTNERNRHRARRPMPTPVDPR